MQNADYQSLRQLRRMAEQRPEAFTEPERVRRTSGCDSNTFRWMGWYWQAPGRFCAGRTPPRVYDTSTNTAMSV